MCSSLRFRGSICINERMGQETTEGDEHSCSGEWSDGTHQAVSLDTSTITALIITIY